MAKGDCKKNQEFVRSRAQEKKIQHIRRNLGKNLEKTQWKRFIQSWLNGFIKHLQFQSLRGNRRKFWMRVHRIWRYQRFIFTMNGIVQMRDLIKKGDWATSLDLKSAFHRLIIYPPHRPYQAFEAIEKVFQIRAMPFGTQHSPVFIAQALAIALTKIQRESDIRILNCIDNLFLLHQVKEILRKQTQSITRILKAFGWAIVQKKYETEPKQQIKFLRSTWDFKRIYLKMTDQRKQELRLQLRNLISPVERNLNQDQVSSIENSQAEFFNSLSKRSFAIYKVNGLSKNESTEEQKMEREYDPTQGNPSRTLLVAGNDSEELRNDIRGENARGNDGIRRIPQRLWSDFGTTNRGYFSPTWRMEQGTEEVDKQQEGDESHILRTIPLRISLQRAANQSDHHQLRQLNSSIRFSKTDSWRNTDNRSEENSQVMSTIENTNTDSTKSGNLKQSNRRTKRTKHPGRLFSKERDIHSFVPNVVDNTNTGLVRNRGKQTRGQIRGNRRGRGRGRMVKRVFETMEGGDLLDPPTNSEDWKSTDRMGKVQTKINHDSTLMAKVNMVRTLANRQLQILYSWSELSTSEPGEGDDEEEGHATTRKNRGIPHGPRVDQGRRILTEFLDNINMTRETQQTIIE
ncbi:MAG: hypothetical protein EZS28_001614 [Streblomastix strix]|uniref:Reverse transcriptase domain-containing protein n=1 Tax=Streblomastix strix TaxID=222440 RepID=A0A5J4X6J5_9EUKA|nr:MAG: hypothetical protein EZS28_001614 [Streblomastix strix]